MKKGEYLLYFLIWICIAVICGIGLGQTYGGVNIQGVELFKVRECDSTYDWKGDRSAPYVLWGKFDKVSDCIIPLFRTGYPSGLEIFFKKGSEANTVANRVTKIEVELCPTILNRCYILKWTWTDEKAGEQFVRRYGFGKEKACSLALIRPKSECR